MIGPKTEIICPDCGKIIKQYYVCHCGIFYVENTDDRHLGLGNHHIIIRKYEGNFLFNYDTETQEYYKYHSMSLHKITAGWEALKKMRMSQEEEMKLGWEGSLGFDNSFEKGFTP